MNKDLGKSVNDEINNAYEEGIDNGVLDALNRMEDVYNDACDILEDILEDDGATVSEKAFANYLMSSFFDVMYDLMMDEFEIEPVCCDNCDCCDCCDESDDTEDFYERVLETLKEDCNEEDCDCEDDDNITVYVVEL